MDADEGDNERGQTITISAQGDGEDGDTVYAHVSDGTYQAVVTDASQVRLFA